MIGSDVFIPLSVHLSDDYQKTVSRFSRTLKGWYVSGQFFFGILKNTLDYFRVDCYNFFKATVVVQSEDEPAGDC